MSVIQAVDRNTETRVLQVGNRQIHLADMGGGPPVLMLHGGGPGASGVSNYARNITALAAHFRVLVPDMPGYGKSSKGLNSNDIWGDLADTMLGLLDALGIARAHLVGNSAGGGCALRMALDQPERIGRLVLMGPGGVDVSKAPPTDGLKRLLTYYTGDGPTFEKLSRFITEDLVYDGSQVPKSVLRERYEASIAPEVIANPPLRAPGDPATLAKLDLTLDPRLPALTNPTLVLWGVEDRVNPVSGGVTLQKLMSHCDLYLFSRTGHWVQWERADEFNAAVSAFLKEEEPAANPAIVGAAA
ncbi:alpha/beta fold hydrolase [Cupriavidus sp. WKF15]|uniref:alpha/beta fold hydrolase n=1 Tax=Cupriavidus sp. WKF15 TaxID=3032282 RepID=UPI0023E2F0F7|nr:alpha/beta fold hydrolase [Cupriavidus sp. WKF15]WER49019.1 alpha/beta fold hydrolase [Cupriavidus sp. WKF15]